MNRKIAQTINSVLNVPKITDAINDYIDFRIEVLRDTLERSKEIDKIREIQGSIEELRRFRKIREHAIQVLEQENNNGRKG